MADPLEAHLFIERIDGQEMSEDAIDDFLFDMYDFLNSKGWTGGGSFGPPLPAERECGYCEGSGMKDTVPEEARCDTCGGSGQKEEVEESNEDSVESWNDLYAPVAQRTEQPFPKRQVEGSSPSESATFEEELEELRSRIVGFGISKEDEETVDRLFSEAERRAGRRSIKEKD